MALRPALLPLLLLLPLLASLAAGAANGGGLEAAEALGWRAEPGEEAAGGVGVPASPGPKLRRRGSSPRGAGAGLPPFPEAGRLPAGLPFWLLPQIRRLPVPPRGVSPLPGRLPPLEAGGEGRAGFEWKSRYLRGCPESCFVSEA